jgi:hypothetical protein
LREIAKGQRLDFVIPALNCMRKIDTEAGQLSAERNRRGVAAETRVHVVIDVLDADPLPMAAIAQAGKALDWLADEPDLYADADLFAHAG